MQRTCSSFLSCAAALALAACSPIGGLGERERVVVPSTATSEWTVVDGIEYELSFTELGVVVEPGEKGEDMLIGVTSSDRILHYTPEHWVLSVPTQERDDVLTLAIAAEVQLPRFVRAAGPVLRRANDDTPFILGRRVVVDFRPEVDDRQARSIITSNGGLVVRRNLRDASRYSIDVDIGAAGSGPADALLLAAALRRHADVESAEAVLIVPVIEHGALTPDPLLGRQWHHDNDAGVTGGTTDADVDTKEAWALEQGSAGVVIAIIDSGFEDDHGDLLNKRWMNPDETQNGVDDDDNGFIDDIHGWNFEVSPGSTQPPPNDFHERPHGTSVAGLAGAERDNGIGGAGTCPMCPLMLIERGLMPDDHAAAIDYAVLEGARVLNLSWGYKGSNLLPTEVAKALDDAVQDGAVVVVAMNNAGSTDECLTTQPRLGSHTEVISVSGSDHHDRRADNAYGECMDILAPVDFYDPLTDVTFGIATTDLSGTPGYNSALSDGTCSEVVPQESTACFGGNSAAAPIVSGVIGLVLSADVGLTPDQVRYLLRDTADRVEHSQARYRLRDGRGEVPHPLTGTAGATPTTSQHGSGRVNAFEAVRVVAPTSAGGRGGVDVFLRDNHLDWGNTERPSNYRFEEGGAFIAHWKSVDIKVDAPPYGMPAQPTSEQFESFQHENPRSLALNHVWVRVRNRGPVEATDVDVRLFRAFAGAGLPLLPSDYAGPGAPSSSAWSFLGERVVGKLAYSGSSVAATAADPAAVVRFDFTGPPIDSSQPNPRHHCFLAVTSALGDPVSSSSLVPDVLTPNDNNVTHRNVRLLDPALQPGPFGTEFLIRNPFRELQPFRLRVDGPEVGIVLDLRELGLGELSETRTSRVFELAPGAEVRIRAQLLWPVGVTGDVDFVQERLVDEGWEALGGWTVSSAR